MKFNSGQNNPKPPIPEVDAASAWKARYGAIHQLRRVTEFPVGVQAPQKVRLYHRRDHFIVQWWDPSAKRTLSKRIAGDLIEAIAEARRIDTRLLNFRSAAYGKQNLSHEELVSRFVVDLHRRADAGEISAATVVRYESAINHYRGFCARYETDKRYPKAANVDREFRLEFQSWLANNAMHNSRDSKGAMPTSRLILDTVRAMFNWAGDHARGNLLPEGFRNPFDKVARAQRGAANDPFGEPDITMLMAVQFISRCDAFQLPLFATLILYGLRASEPCLLFHENLDEQWIKVNCLPELDYLTKGQRDKRFPLIPELAAILTPGIKDCRGLLFSRRTTGTAQHSVHLRGASLQDLTSEFQRLCRTAGSPSAVQRQKIREQLLRAVGGLNYDLIENEFLTIACELDWPPAATLKDFRHLFSTCLENAGVPEFYRRYFMGQSPGKSAIVTYTHLNELEIQFSKAVQHSLAPLVAAIAARHGQLSQNS